tara:strand:+ start:640 stop:1104 length:465 start_codon:yes stop_codon:yes gene_type:complete
MFKNINWNISNICRLIIPLILGFSMNAIPQCKMNKNAGSVVKFRPPSYMFGIVWTILYILFGISWIITISKNKNKLLIDLLYSLVTILLTLWIVVYSCLKNKKGGVYVLFGTICSVILCMNISPIESRMMLSLLLTWLLLASLLNTFEVQTEKS